MSGIGDAFRKVRPGDRLRIPAEWFNTVTDVAMAHKQGKTGFGFSGNLEFNGDELIRIKNASGSDVARFGILGLDDFIISPTDNQQEFQNKINFEGVTPLTASHYDGYYAVLIEPIKNGKIGWARIGGIVPVQVNITDDAHWWADITNSDATKLTSGHAGTAKILMKESGTGTKWCYVQLGTSNVGVVLRAKTQEAAQGDAYISVKLLNAAGSEVGAAFDATCIFTDGATAANTCLPDVATGKTVLISKIQGTWYIVNPTFTDWSECAS